MAVAVPSRRTPRRLPAIYSRQELERLFAAAPAGKRRCLLMTMGHACISSTAAYLHLTQKSLGNTPHPLDLLDLSKRARLKM
jgi:hypothetical protein